MSEYDSIDIQNEISDLESSGENNYSIVVIKDNDNYIVVYEGETIDVNKKYEAIKKLFKNKRVDLVDVNKEEYIKKREYVSACNEYIYSKLTI